jgi:serine/threonine protein kinase
MSTDGRPLQDRSGAGLEVADAGRNPSRQLVSDFKALWAQSASADAREFLSAYPELNQDQSLVLDLAYEEYCLRRDAGAAPDPDEFCRRFPLVKTSLRELIETHRLLAESISLSAGGLPTDWPQTGDHLLGFTLERELGRGAFARVFLAAETALGDRPVAVKISRHGAAEAGILGRLRHPNIVPIHSVDEDPVLGYTVVCMPYLGSATLSDVFERAFAGREFPSRARAILDAARNLSDDINLISDRQPPDPLLQKGTYTDGVALLGAQLAEALAFAHAQRIYHRDLKPSNVLLTPDGKPMLLDFNLSYDERVAGRRLGGTLPYMAPEQLLATDPDRQADPLLVDARSDLFSLGVILYELLTGTHPFGPIPPKLAPAQFRNDLLQRQMTGHSPLRLANPQVDPRVARIVDRSLAFALHDRPGSATELARALRTSVAPWQRGRRWVVRHARVFLGAALLVLLAGLATGYALSLREPAHLAPLRIGLEAYAQQRYRDAVDRFNRAVEAAPDNPWFRFARGRAYQQLATLQWINQEESKPLFDKALDDYTEADQRTQDGRIMVCIGVCHSLDGNRVKAIDAYNRALAAGSMSPELLNNLGCAYLQGGTKEDLDQARGFLDHAIALNPELTVAYHNRVGWFAPTSSASAAIEIEQQPDPGIHDRRHPQSRCSKSTRSGNCRALR